MIKKSLLKKFNSIVGEKNIILEEEKLEDFAVDNVLPTLVVSPNNIEEVSEVMKLASKNSLRVIPIGSGTKSSLGNKPDGIDIILSTKNLNKIIEHGASDLVATTEAGISLKKFQAELNKENQFLALDPPHIKGNATIGGIIATNDSGPERLKYGTVREFLIGLKVVMADGSIFKGGSKVVKNVAGYDLPKLYVGSLGTLGIIVEATFRLYPVPEYSETYIASFSELEDCQETVLALLNSDLVLTSLEILNPELTTTIAKRNHFALEAKSYSLIIGIKNVEKAVKDQISTVKSLCEKYKGNGFVLNGAKEDKIWHEIQNFSEKFVKAEHAVCKANILVTQIPILLDYVEQLTDKNGVKIYSSTRAGNGISILAIKGKAQSIKNTLSELRNFLSSIEGSLILQEASHDIKNGFDVWGDMGSGVSIMKRIKANFDPDNILNPGRFI